jgi:hypothetical protein
MWPQGAGPKGKSKGKVQIAKVKSGAFNLRCWNPKGSSTLERTDRLQLITENL